jgi:hypothetical protein
VNWEFHLNDAFKDALDITITGFSQMAKPRGDFTQIFHTIPPVI